jgi:hypothetical protein
MIVVAALALALGCADNSKTAAVSGTVTLDGEPIESGSINFFPVEGTTGPSAGGTIENGHYSVPREKGVVIGRNRVELQGNMKTGRKVPSAIPGEKERDELVSAFPPEYSSDSKLVREINPGSNIINFDLSSKGDSR